MLSTRRIISTVMIKDTRPSVKKLIGKVNNLRINPIVAFASAIKIAAIKALEYPATSTPGTNFAPIKKANPIKRISIINLIMLNLKMVKNLNQQLLIFLVAAFFISCSGRNNKAVIKFSADSSSIIINNLGEASLVQVKNAYSGNLDSANLISVIALPGELDSLQDEIAVKGNYALRGDSIIFKPNQPFIKNKTYLIESFIGAEFATVNKLILGTIKQNLQPQKEILKR